jgi:hypothetical protein
MAGLIGEGHNHKLDYPINFWALVLDDDFSEYQRKGTIYIDDLVSQ